MNNVIIITGGNRGIGKAIAKRFSKEGYEVIITFNSNQERAEETIKELKSIGAANAHSFRVDVSNEESVRNFAESVNSIVDHVNVLVNNAGVISYTPFEQMTLDEWNKIISIDLTGVFLVTKYLLNLLKKSEWASIVNISSIAGQTGSVYGGVSYSAAKAGVIGFTKRLSNELAKYGIRVNAVAPSFVDTDMVADVLKDENRKKSIIDLHPLKIILKPEDVAESVFFLSDPKLSRGITGHILSINAGRYT
ncbi:SDR family NAD(P)-dependent oxidoreductase [Caldisphaera sp.]|uniref:SDR family NAD(P)-dependent oxidoreductase n=1 Tax=Caldisphaera sp. TaxID=2060322 RepID=UPI0025C399CA|nr:SDR family NAD(P)-dependent oxidoreductase [Caldisphaera sp.]